MPLPYICCVTSQQIIGVLKRETLWSLASGCWADLQGGPAGNLRVMTAVYCSQAQASGGEYPRGRLCVGAGRRREVQGGAWRVSTPHAAAWPLLKSPLSSTLKSTRSTHPMWRDPPPPAPQIIAVTIVYYFSCLFTFGRVAHGRGGSVLAGCSGWNHGPV